MDAIAALTEDTRRKQAMNALDERHIGKELEKVREAIESNHPNGIQDFVQFHARHVNCEFPNIGHTPLTLATHYGRSHMVEILLNSGGANPNIATTPQKNTPLHIAVNFNYKRIVNLLLDAGADETLTNADNLLPWEGIVPKDG